MSLPLVFVIGMAALVGSATVIAEIRLRVLIRRFNNRLEGLDSRIQGLEIHLKSARASKNSPEKERPIEPTHTSLVRRRVDPPLPSSIEGPSLIAIPDLSAGRSVIDTTVSNELEGRFSEIWASGDLGVPPGQIARESGLPLGQVELILGLRRLARPTFNGPNGDVERGAS